MNKKVNKSNSGRNAAAHYVRRSNMDLAIAALAEGIPSKVTRFDRRRGTHVVEVVQPGPACSAVLRPLGDLLPGGLSSAPNDIRSASTPTAALSRGTFPGAATWSSIPWEARGVRGQRGRLGGTHDIWTFSPRRGDPARRIPHVLRLQPARLGGRMQRNALPRLLA